HVAFRLPPEADARRCRARVRLADDGGIESALDFPLAGCGFDTSADGLCYTTVVLADGEYVLAVQCGERLLLRRFGIAGDAVVGGFLGNDIAAGPPDTLSVHFAQSVSDVSFVYHQVGTQTPSTFRAKLQGTTVDSFTILWNETQPNNFFGFAKTALDEVEIDF